MRKEMTSGMARSKPSMCVWQAKDKVTAKELIRIMCQEKCQWLPFLLVISSLTFRCGPAEIPVLHFVVVNA